MSLKLFYTEVTLPDGEKWCCTAIQHKATVSASVAWLNKTAEQRKLGSTYRAISRAEYLEYQAKVKAAIAEGKAAPIQRPLIQS